MVNLLFVKFRSKQSGSVKLSTIVYKHDFDG